MKWQPIQRRKSGVIGLALGNGQFVVVVARDAAGLVVGGEDAAVEQQRQFAVAVAGEHVAEELVVAADQPAGIVGLGGGIDDDVRARPEFAPAFQLVGLGGLAGGRSEQRLSPRRAIAADRHPASRPAAWRSPASCARRCGRSTPCRPRTAIARRIRPAWKGRRRRPRPRRRRAAWWHHARPPPESPGPCALPITSTGKSALRWNHTNPFGVGRDVVRREIALRAHHVAANAVALSGRAKCRRRRPARAGWPKSDSNTSVSPANQSDALKSPC